MRNKKSGSSIVSVITAFAILMLGVQLFAAALLAANKSVSKTISLNYALSEAMEEYYTSEDYPGENLFPHQENGMLTFTLTDKENGDSFSVKGNVYEYKAKSGYTIFTFGK